MHCGKQTRSGFPCQINISIWGTCPTHDLDPKSLSARNQRAATNAARNPEYRKSLSARGKNGYKTTKERHGKDFAIQALAKHFSQNPSQPEVWLYAKLDELGIKYQKQEIICCQNQHFILDASTQDWIIEISGYLNGDNPFGRGDEPRERFLSKAEIIRECDRRDLLILDWEDEGKEEELEEFLKQIKALSF
jgi:hypothetical protein